MISPEMESAVRSDAAIFGLHHCGTPRTVRTVIVGDTTYQALWCPACEEEDDG